MQWFFDKHKRKVLLYYQTLLGIYGSFGVAIRVTPWDSKEVFNAIHEALNIHKLKIIVRSFV